MQGARLRSHLALTTTHFVTNLDWFASQPIQICFAVHIFFGPDFLCILLWGQSCGRQLYDDIGVIVAWPLARWRRHIPHRNCLCWINDAHRPPLSLLLSSSLFGVLGAFIATGGIVAVWHHCHHHCHCRHCCRHCRRCHRCCRVHGNNLYGYGGYSN
jgi:hypothetical protein